MRHEYELMPNAFPPFLSCISSSYCFHNRKRRRGCFMTMQTLLTGFGAFGAVAHNPTLRLAEHFANRDAAGHALTCAVLPVSFRTAAERMRALIEIGGAGGRPFEMILMLGVASGSPYWRVERFGRNWDDALTDAEGFTPIAGKILPEGPSSLPVTLPIEPQIAAIEALGLPVRASDSAGAYLCNHVLYTTLHHLQNCVPPIRAGFLHVPADEETFDYGITSAPMFPFAQHIAAVEAVLAALSKF